jgi:drug/metabolite transporter (DMT)-like permease
VELKTKAHLGLLSANIFFSINLSAVKYLTTNHFVQSFGINLIRVAVSTILFWILYLGKPVKSTIDRADIPRFIICALTGIAFNQMLFLKGLSLTYSIHAVLLILSAPIFITIFAALFLKERITVIQMIGLGLGIFGAVLLISMGKNSGTGDNVLLGDTLILINALCYTIYFIMVKPLMLKYNPVQVTRMIFTIGFFVVLPFGWNEFTAVSWNSFGWLEYGCLGLIVVGGTFLAYLFNLYGIKILGASITGAYIYLQPIFAAIIAMIFLNESLGWYKVVAGILIFTGVYLTNKKITHE